MLTLNLTVTQIYTIDLAEQTYQISQFPNNTVSIYCLEQLDYPILALSLYSHYSQINGNETQLWLVFESPAENKARVEYNVPLPVSWKQNLKTLNTFTQNNSFDTGLVSSLMASYTSDTEYLVIYQNNTFNYIVFDTFTANYGSGNSKLSCLVL